MIDSHNPDPHSSSSEPQHPPRPEQGRPKTPRSSQVSDIYSDLFADQSSASRQQQPQKRPPQSSPPPQAATSPDQPSESLAPISPTTLSESGLTLMQLCDLILKQIYLQGSMLGAEIARNSRLPFSVIDEGLRFLKAEKCIEVSSGEVIGRVSYRFSLTDLGRNRARESFEQCRYVGPAPVPLEDYVAQCRQQAVTGTACTPEALRQAFRELIIKPELLEELGPAVCSGKSIFIYGPPGNGKTMIAKGLGKFLNAYGGDIYVPYAIQTENSIVTLFDPTIHHPTDQRDQTGAGRDDPLQMTNDPLPDLRWRRVRRPVVITGGELTLDMLDLRYNKTSNFYTAPLHIKANCGVFLIDDFGRQIVSPRDLLNRWILPLEERVDYLTLATGKKFSVPFEQLIIFSTNLDPRELVDEAFLRRIRHKIHIGSPDRSLYSEIFRLCCELQQIPFSEAAVEYLFNNYYNQGKPPRSSDPRDLLEIAQSICRFRNQQVLLTEELMAEATHRFFCQV